MQLKSGTTLGKGWRHAADSVEDLELLQEIRAYRRRVVGSYRSIKPNEITTALFGGPFQVSPKVDGELWFMLIENGQAYLLTNHGKALSGAIPLLEEAAQLAKGLSGRILIAGELFAASTSKTRPRVGDVASALAGGAEAAVERLGFMMFDLLQGLTSEPPQSLPYEERIKPLREHFAQGKRARFIRTDQCESPTDVNTLFGELVEGGKGEGLVVRNALGSIFKIKPEFSLDAVVLGYTTRTEDPEAVRTLLLGLTREDGHTQVVGHCGNLGGDTQRRELLSLLKELVCESSFRHPSRTGDMFTFIRPERVVEVNTTDLQPESGDGQPVRSMVLEYADGAWKPIGLMPCVSWLHPVLMRVRDDKQPGTVDTRFSQILERCAIDQANQAVDLVQLPVSQIVRREVWSKETKGKLAVRKLVAWKTNKENLDPNYPAYVIHWTDFSSGRATPLDREVRTAPNLELLEEIASKLIEENIKKGWEKVH